jgi:presenilin 1
MLVAMALYDLYAVLTPNGPLRLMVELAQERDEDIPALVYESRGTGANGGRRGYARVKTDDNDPSGAPASSSSSYDPSMADEGARYTLPDSIKLGLGDFIFYSVLVGRAAMWSPITCTFCFIAVISGLVVTLLALGLYGKALPALPVSIALGVSTYFLSRFLLEPAIVRWYAREFVCA